MTPRPPAPDAAPFHLPKERLEALVDGVFAIAMTILVLEVKIPELEHRRDSAELFAKLRHALPTIGAYFFSFLMLGIFWNWFHRQAAKLARFDKTLLALSLFFLALVSFFPFAAGLIGHYPVNPAALAVYLPVIGLIVATQTLSFALAVARGLVDPAVPAVEIRAALRSNLRGCMLFCLFLIPTALRLGTAPVVVCLLAAGALGLLMRRRYPALPADGGGGTKRS